MVELADTRDLGSRAEKREGSNPSLGINLVGDAKKNPTFSLVNFDCRGCFNSNYFRVCQNSPPGFPLQPLFSFPFEFLVF